MNFDYIGYDLKFIVKKPCKDGGAHQFTLIYKFFSTVTKYQYILHADYHLEDVFAIKFYCKKDSKSDFKYSKIVNKGDLGNILITCAKVVPLLLEKYPTASFGFGAARSVDVNNKTVENYMENQRFAIYKEIAILKFGGNTFTHFEFPQISSYLLINNQGGDIEAKKNDVVNMFALTYQTLPDIT